MVPAPAPRDPFEVLRLAQDVRNAQRAYFRSRIRTDLEKAKRLETDLDAALAEILQTGPRRDPRLFD